MIHIPIDIMILNRYRLNNEKEIHFVIFNSELIMLIPQMGV